MRPIRSVFILALVFIVAGIALTLENIGIVTGAGKFWPSFVLFLGLGFLTLFFQRHRNDLALLFLGTVVTLIGFFFFYFSFTEWGRMSTMWPFFLTIAGIGFSSIYLAGRHRLFLFLAVALILLSGVFYMVFGISLHLWPLSLVAFGVSLLFVNFYYPYK
jgi:hypothetical protein